MKCSYYSTQYRTSGIINHYFMGNPTNASTITTPCWPQWLIWLIDVQFLFSHFWYLRTLESTYPTTNPKIILKLYISWITVFETASRPCLYVCYETCKSKPAANLFFKTSQISESNSPHLGPHRNLNPC